MALQSVTDADFQSVVLNSSIPVCVDFYAPWCSPCRAIGPVVEKLAGNYAGKLLVVKCNTDDAQQTAAAHISSVPTVLFFKGGQIVARHNGVVTLAQLTGSADAAIK